MRYGSFGELGRSLQAQGSVWSGIVVIIPPVGDDDAGFTEGVNEFPIQAFLPEAAIEALHIAILPWATRINVEGFDFIVLEPLLDRIGDELGSVVRADVFGRTMTIDRLLKDLQNICGLDCSVGMDAVAFAGVLVNQVEGPQLATALGVVADYRFRKAT